MRSPVRAWARASVAAHRSPNTVSARAFIASTSSVPFQSRSWRT